MNEENNLHVKKVLLIYPPPSSDQLFQTKCQPFGLLFLSDALRKHGYSSDIIELPVADCKKKIDESYGKNNDILCIGISSLSGTQLKHGVEIAKHVKEKHPETTIVFGGAHVTALSFDTLNNYFVDYVVWGEGEKSFPALLSCIENNAGFSEVKGIGYKKNGFPIITENVGYTKLEDCVFNLEYEKLSMGRYARKMAIGMDRCFYVFTSRGCPFRCKFCSNSSRIWPNTAIRFHSIDHIIRDIGRHVKEYYADGITFADENFFLGEERLLEVCDALKKAAFPVKYRAQGNAKTLSGLRSSTWDVLKETGFIGFVTGVESGSQRMLDFMRKGITVEQVLTVDKILTRYGFYKTFNFMTCLPTETIDDVCETLRLIVNLSSTNRYCPYPFGLLHKYIPLPGTEMYDVAVEHGFSPPLSIEGWFDFDFENISATRKTVRPWISDALFSFVDESNNRIESLNALFTGKSRDDLLIDDKINEMNEFIEYKDEWGVKKLCVDQKRKKDIIR